MKIVVHGRNFNETAKPFIQLLFDKFASKQFQVQISASFVDFLTSVGVNPHTTSTYNHSSEIIDADFMFTIGGDGTLLDAVAHVGAKQTPIIGINTGRLGFLATVSPNEIEAMLNALWEKQYEIEKRTLVGLESDKDLFDGANFALNDLTITKTDISSMITIHTYLDGQFLNSYWADGLILSTPTGSTGYSLSCGGPVLLPQNQNFILTPISPHNLNVRPMIIPDSSELSFSVVSRSNNFLVSLDTRFKIVDGSTKFTVRRENFKAHLVRFDKNTFLNTLRQKLNWGLDVRN
jgi:NAD+ kinase